MHNFTLNLEYGEHLAFWKVDFSKGADIELIPEFINFSLNRLDPQ